MVCLPQCNIVALTCRRHYKDSLCSPWGSTLPSHAPLYHAEKRILVYYRHAELLRLLQL